MNARLFAPVAVLLLSLLASCAQNAPAKPESSIDPTADIPALKTFGWQPATNNLVSTDVTQRKFDESIRKAISTDLSRKGYIETTTDPDILVAYEIAAYEKTKTNPFSVGVGMGSWGGNVGGSVGVGTGGNTRTVEESRLAIRAMDRKADKEIFIGTMVGNISPGARASRYGPLSARRKDFSSPVESELRLDSLARRRFP